MEALGGAPDLVMSDMAANTVGHPQTDALRTMALVETALAFAVDVLEKGGTFVAKVFAGGADAQLVAEMKRNFQTVKHAKPPAAARVRWNGSSWRRGSRVAKRISDANPRRVRPRPASRTRRLTTRLRRGGALRDAPAVIPQRPQPPLG